MACSAGDAGGNHAPATLVSFHLDKVSYWSRTVIVPLLVLMAEKPQAKNPRQIQIRELFAQDPATITDWIRGPYRSKWGHLFGTVDRILMSSNICFPRKAANGPSPAPWPS